MKPFPKNSSHKPRRAGLGARLDAAITLLVLGTLSLGVLGGIAIAHVAGMGAKP